LFSLLSKVFSQNETAIKVNESLTPALLSASQIAVFAHYSDQVDFSASDAYLISQLKAAGFAVVVSSTCTSDLVEHQQIWEQWQHKIDGLITRENIGFDFGSWAAALSVLNLSKGHIDQIILINNSVYGPLFPLEPIISELCLRGDFYGLTASREFCPHVQSYFLGFNKVVVENPVFREYWQGTFRGASKWFAIFRRELAWENFFTKQGFCSAVLIEDSREFPRNPLTFLWKDLISQGFPFIKKSLFTHNYDSIDMTDWENFVMKECPKFDTTLVSHDLKH
jgi:lipopolysaccharide biosynthesis protein